MRRIPLRRVLPYFSLALFGLGLWVLHRELAAHDVREILENVQTFTLPVLLAALALTTINFLVLTGYDGLAVRYARRPLPYRRTAFASFLGYSFSQTLGFPLLTGAPLRLRLYSSWGLSALAVARIVGFSAVSFWLGFCALTGTVLMVDPASVVLLYGLPHWLVRPLGAVLLALPGGYLFWTLAVRRPFRIRALELTPPRPSIALAQIPVGMLDWTLSASVLFVLLPDGHGLSLTGFLGVYLLAQVVGLLSHVPGGLGVFEAMILLVMPGVGLEDNLLASIFVFRLIFYFLPLMVAAAALGIYEMTQRRRELARAADLFETGVSAAAPFMVSGTVFAAGALLLLSGALPTPSGHLEWLVRFLPLELIELSHFLGSFVGALLLILAWGLYRRLDAAYGATVALLVLGMLTSVARGGAILHLGALALVLVSLVGTRREFYRTASITGEPFSREWAGLVLVVLASFAWLGLFAYRHVEYSDDLWWSFALRGDAPRSLRAAVAVVAVFLVFGLVRLLGPARHRWKKVAPGELPPEVDDLVRHSPRANAHLVYLGDKALLFSKSRRSFIMYAVHGRTWVSMGDPVGDEAEFPELVWRFRAEADRAACRAVFYLATPARLPLYVDLGLALLEVGEEARVPLHGFSLEGGARTALRETVRRLDDDGAMFEVIPPPDLPPIMPELRRISDQWLERRRGRARRFSQGHFSEAYLHRTPVAVVRMADRLVAFANVWAGTARAEMSADLMRYGDDAPAGVMDFLFARLMGWGRDQGYAHFSLGVAPPGGLDDRPLAPLWSLLGAAVFRHGEHFHDLQGMRDYKARFGPVWEPRYLASPGGLAVPRALAAISALISSPAA